MVAVDLPLTVQSEDKEKRPKLEGGFSRYNLWLLCWHLAWFYQKVSHAGPV